MRKEFEEALPQVAKAMKQSGEGATINAQTGQGATSGWAVAQAGHEHVEPTKSFSEDSLKRYAGANREPLEQAGYMGLWHPSRVPAGRPKGVYHDVVEVKPDTYRGGLESIVQGYSHQQDAVFNIDRFDEMHMHPQTRSQVRGTRTAVRNLEAQRPGGKGTPVAEQAPEQLRAGLRGRQPVDTSNVHLDPDDPLVAYASHVAAKRRGAPPGG
jgi:hypothetical protein